MDNIWEYPFGDPEDDEGEDEGVLDYNSCHIASHVDFIPDLDTLEIEVIWV